MTIPKKLFLMAILGLGLGLQISASEYDQDKNEQKFFSFINGLKNLKTTASLELARWMDTVYATNPELSDKLINIVGTDEPLLDKTKVLSQLKENTAQKSGNTSYFSSMRTLATAAAALLITAGIASYFYFARPWATRQ